MNTAIVCREVWTSTEATDQQCCVVLASQQEMKVAQLVDVSIVHKYTYTRENENENKQL
eukprot:m.46458 g.46458  ORF g.46458 m.46458 type:complete len:59 (-) comp10719_c0_seq16:2148-2324(-)